MVDASNFGVPMGDGTMGGIQQPLLAYRFRIMAPSFRSITANTKSVQFDFVKKTITATVNQSVLPQAFEDAVAFAAAPEFSVDAMDGRADGPVFTIRPAGLKLVDHTFELDYASSSEVACHIYSFTYDSLLTGEYIPGIPAEHAPDPLFPTPAEAIAALNGEEPEVLELTEEQEARFTPDNPDADGDGVPDSVDAYPKDATRS